MINARNLIGARNYAFALWHVAKGRWLTDRPRPFSLSHMVTNRCNGTCCFCSFAFLDHMIERKNHYPCHWPRITFTMYSDGAIVDCETRHVVGDVRRQTIREVLESPGYRAFAAKAGSCRHGCLSNETYLASGLWTLQPGSLKTFVEMLFKN